MEYYVTIKKCSGRSVFIFTGIERRLQHVGEFKTKIVCLVRIYKNYTVYVYACKKGLKDNIKMLFSLLVVHKCN